MSSKDQGSSAVEAFRRYTQAFQSLDPLAVATHFNEPAMMITPQGVQALPNAAAVEKAYARVSMLNEEGIPALNDGGRGNKRGHG
jgi:hypothetical protein